MPYSGQASLHSAAGHTGSLVENQEEEQAAAQRPTELERMQQVARKAETEEKKATGRVNVQQGGTAANLKAGAEYLEKEVSSEGEVLLLFGSELSENNSDMQHIHANSSGTLVSLPRTNEVGHRVDPYTREKDMEAKDKTKKKSRSKAELNIKLSFFRSSIYSSHHFFHVLNPFNNA